MPHQTATMAAHARAAQARVDWIEHCLEVDDLAPPISGWRLGLAVAIVTMVLALLALPVVAVLDPPLAGQAAGWLGRLAAVVPVLTGVRALLFVVAAVAISRSDARP